ncbi:neurofibromin-like isoform X2 [Apostichopus japonicus]|uniref:neurofibromin-like isoform X2 n=1 Tax=Stichopus japonicus TaxID=307972 RepID=UPI003AB7214E
MAAAQRPIEWVSLLLARFELQLPYYISGEASHVGADLERNRECLIKLSRNLFSSVINGLARLLKNLSLKPLTSGENEKSLYQSQLIILDTLEKCLAAQPKDTTRSDETMLVKTLLPQLCLLLNYDSCDHLLISQLKTSAARVLYALSLNNFNAVFSRISACLESLTKTSDEACDESDIELIQHINVNLERLIKLLNETIPKFFMLKKNSMSTLAVSLEKAIWNWMDNYPDELVKLEQNGNVEIKSCCDRLFQLADTHPEMQSHKKKSSVWLLQVMLLVLCPLLLNKIVKPNPATQQPPLQKLFLDSLRKWLCATSGNKQLTEGAVVACVKLCKAASYVKEKTDSKLYEIAFSMLTDLKLLLFNPLKPLSRFQGDVGLMIEFAVACYHLRPGYPDHFATCLSANAPPYFAVVLVRALHTIITKNNMPWWPKIDKLYATAEQLRNLFATMTKNIQQGSSKYPPLSNFKYKVGLKSRDKPGEDSPYPVLLWLVKLVHADPKLMLYVNPDRQGHEIQQSTLQVVQGLMQLMCQDGANVHADVAMLASEALLTLHKPENVELWNREAPIATFWDISSQILFSVGQKLLLQQIANTTDILKWLSEVLALRNSFLNKYKDQSTAASNIPRTRDAQNKLECVFFMNIWSTDQEAVSTALTCLGQLCEEAEICCGADDYALTQVVPNYTIYSDIADLVRIGPQEKTAMRRRIFSLLRKIEYVTQGNSQAWRETYHRWMKTITIQMMKAKECDGTQDTRGSIRRRGSSYTVQPTEQLFETWQNMTGFLCALGGVWYKPHTPRVRFDSPDGEPFVRQVSLTSNGSCAEDQQQLPVGDFLSFLLKLLVCSNEAFGAQIRETVKDLIGRELDATLYPQLFQLLKEYVDKFFDPNLQVQASDENTMFVEHAIQVLKQILENNTEEDESAEHLGVMSIEELILAIVRYVRRLDPSPTNTYVMNIKVQVCRLLSKMMVRRDILSFRQEIWFRNKLVGYLSDWILMFSHDGPVNDIKALTRDLDEASMDAMAVLLEGLPLQPEEGDLGDIMEAKSDLFLKYFTLFMNLLNETSEGEEEKSNGVKTPTTTDNVNANLRTYTIQAMTNLLNANIDSGLTHSISLGYHQDVQTRAAFIEVLTKILQQGTEFDTLADTVLADRFDRLVGLVTMLGDKGELPIAMALANVVSSSQMDELARVFVAVFDAKHLLYQLLWNMFSKEVEIADSLQTLFRGNSLASKIMTYCFKMYGAIYLRGLLEGLVSDMMSPDLNAISYEVDPKRMDQDENLERNQRNLIELTEKFFSTIIKSVIKFPAQLRSVCHCLYQVVAQRFPQNAFGAVGSAIFLRFINPAIVSPYEHGIVEPKPSARVERGLKLVSKILQNIANHVYFKEQHMTEFNNFLKDHFKDARSFFHEIASDNTLPDTTNTSTAFILESNILALHRLLWNHQEKMGAFLSSSRDHRAVGRRPFDKMITLLAYIGPPEHSRLALDSQWGSMDFTSNNFDDMFTRRNFHNEEDLKHIKSLNIFYQEGFSKAGHPVFYYIARKYKCSQVEIDALIYHIRMTLKPHKKPYEVVLDCTNLGPDNRFKQQHLTRWKVFPEWLNQNLNGVYVYNCNSWLKEYVKRNEKFFSPLKGSCKLVFVESVTKLSEYIESNQQHLPKSTLALDEDPKVFTNALKLSETHRDIRVSIKVGSTAMQVTCMEKTKIMSQHVLLNDIYHASEIKEVTFVDETQFTVFLRDGRMISFMHQECEEVARTIQRIKTKWERSRRQGAPAVHSKIRPKDVPGTILNMALLNLGSNDPCLRSAAYNLLCALTATFNLKMEGQLLETSGLCIPANNTIFIVSISKTLADNEPHLTLEFLEECISGFSKISIELKHLCLEYMTPWLRNLARFSKRAEESKRFGLTVVLDKLISMTIDEVQMYPSIQAKVWGNIGQVEDLIDCVLDSFIKTSVTGGGQPRVEVMADTAVALASANVKLVSAKVIDRLCQKLNKTCLSPTATLEKHLMWDDIAILTRYLLMLSFKNCLDVKNNLPKLFHIVVMLASTGPLPLRASLHGLVINIIHSLCTCSPSEFSDETQKILHLGLTEFSLPKFYQMFGISKVKSAAVTAFRSSYRERPAGQTAEIMPLSYLEAITDALLEIMEACMRDIPDCKWLHEWTMLSFNFAFQHNPALQPRAMVVWGCISKTSSTSQVRDLLLYLAESVQNMDWQSDQQPGGLMLVESIVIALTRLQPLLERDSPLHKLLFWVAVAVLQLEEQSLYAAGLQMMEQNIHCLDEQGAFNSKSPEKILMHVREPLEEWHFKQMDHAVGLSFKFNFNFALVGHLLKGFRHLSQAVVSRTIRILNLMLEIVSKHRNCDQFDVNVESVPYLAALLPYSEEVRSRCSMRKNCPPITPESMEIDNSVFAMPHSQQTKSPSKKLKSPHRSPGVQNAMKTQRSLDSAMQKHNASLCMDKSPLKQYKSLDLSQGSTTSRLGRSPEIVVSGSSGDLTLSERRLRHERRTSGGSSMEVPKSRKERKVSTPSENVLLNEEVLTDTRIQVLLLTVMATLVRNMNEEDAGILYEYLAEASQVFPQVFPAVYPLLDSKIANVLRDCHNQAILAAVQNIITMASDEPASQQTALLHSIGFGALWRFSSPFTEKPQLHASGELFVKLLRALAKQCGNVMDDGAVPIGSPIPFLSSSVPTTLSNSMSSLCSAHPIAEADHHDLSASVGTRRFRHCSANQTTTSRGGAFGKKAGAKR